MGIKLNIKDIEPEGIDPQEKIEMQEAADYFKASAAAHKQNAKEMRKVFLTVGIIVLALAVIFFAIMAWFANTKVADANGMNVNAKKLDYSISTYYVYYTDSSSGTLTYKLSKYSSTVRMPDFDSQFGENDNTAVYLRIPIDSATKFSSDTHKLSLTVNRYASAKWYTADKKKDCYTSSLVALKCGPVPALWSDTGTSDLKGSTSDATQWEALYKAAKEEFASVEGVTFFNDKNNPSNATYKKSITFDIDTYKVYKYKYSTTESGTKIYHYRTYIYVEMDYCEALVRKFYKFDADTGYGNVGTNDYYHAVTKRDSANITVELSKK